MTGHADQQPHDPERSEAQVQALLEMLGPAPKRVVDLGCGFGRTLVPLAAAGHELLGIDDDGDALTRCGAALRDVGAEAQLVEADFRRPWTAPWPDADLVCCLGNTIMLLADVDEAVDVLAHAAGALHGAGAVVIDDCPGDSWGELADGNWQRGVSAGGGMQMVWADDDAVFALRYGDDVDEMRWTPGPSDTPMRLWTAGALRLASRLAGLSAPQRVLHAGLLVLRPCPDGR